MAATHATRVRDVPRVGLLGAGYSGAPYLGKHTQAKKFRQTTVQALRRDWVRA